MHRYPASLAIALLSVPLLGSSACGGPSSTPVSAGAKAGEKYPIVLSRDYEPGKTYRVRINDETKERAVTRLEGKVISDESEMSTLSFVGARKTLSAGKHQPAEYTVDALTKTQDEQTTALLPSGTKIEANAIGKNWHYVVDGQPVSEEVSKALSKLLGGTVGGPTDDEIFGTNVPRAIGESWKVDVSQLPSGDELEFNPQGASGSTRLVAVRRVEGLDCLEIEAKLSIPKVVLKTMPPEAKLLSAGVSGQFLGMFPTDTKLPSLSHGMSIDIEIKMQVQSPNGLVVVDMNMHSERTANRE